MCIYDMHEISHNINMPAWGTMIELDSVNTIIL
jgi:hypothetical protein